MTALCPKQTSESLSKNIVKVYMLKKWDFIESEKFIVKSYSDIVRVLVSVLDGV